MIAAVQRYDTQSRSVCRDFPSRARSSDSQCRLGNWPGNWRDRPSQRKARVKITVMKEEAVSLDDFLRDHERYEQVKYLSRGSSGWVTLARDKVTDSDVALKFIRRGIKITKYVSREIENQLRLRHPHIIDLKEVFLTDDHLVLVMEYASGGDLLGLVTKKRWLSEDDARWYLQQVLFGVDYCHRMGVANRDIKLENTLLQDNGMPRKLVKLADFGFSKDENHQSAPGSRVGTPAYLAPEVITARNGAIYDAKKADVWSIGVLLYIMVTGRYPFQRSGDTGSPGEKLHLMLQRILNGDLVYPPSIPLSESCKDLIAKILVADPVRRPTVQDLLRHPWASLGFEPSILNFNDALVMSSRANPPQPSVVEEVRSIVEEAKLEPREHQQRQQQQQRLQGAQQEGQDAAEGSGSFNSRDVIDFYDEDIEYHPIV